MPLYTLWYMGTQTILNIKIGKKLKESAKETAGKIGVPLSTVVNSFLKQFVRDKEVTFSAQSYMMTPYLELLVEDARKERKTKKETEYFSTAKDFMKSVSS